jgi:hypothetical protein
MHDDEVPELDGSTDHNHHRLSRRNGYGRRHTDPPQVTLGKKLLVILLAFTNVVYLAGDALLNALSQCGH